MANSEQYELVVQTVRKNQNVKKAADYASIAAAFAVLIAVFVHFIPEAQKMKALEGELVAAEEEFQGLQKSLTAIRQEKQWLDHDLEYQKLEYRSNNPTAGSPGEIILIPRED